MNEQLLLVVIATAILSSVLTVGILIVVLKFFAERYIREQLEKVATTLDEQLKSNVDEIKENFLKQFQDEMQGGFEESVADAVPIFRKELSAGFSESAEELLPQFRQEVKAGLIEAMQEVLPTFHKEIEENFKTAVISLASGDLVDKAARKVVQTGSSLVETGLYILRGSRPNNDR